ncbi:MAG: TonB-dependent receptor [Bacteroidia bacterium]|nr:TonB-dependent receptor [Bacteroidia bacterium]
MLKKFIFISLILLSYSLKAQQIQLRGMIISSEDHNGIPGVTVIADSLNGTLTDNDGKYSITLEAGHHTLEFRMLGFVTENRVLELNTHSSPILNVTMKPQAKELGVVVVSAGKFEQPIENVTVSMEVLKPGLIHDYNYTTMEDAMDKVPGVNIIDGQANIRGGSGWSYGAGSRVQVLVDDMPELTADAGDVKWTFLPIENLYQAEVIKGASSVLFGSSALNGVINFRTAFPSEKPLTKINVFSGIYDKSRFSLDDTTYHPSWWGSIPQQYHGLNFLHSQKLGKFDLVAGGYMLDDEAYRRGENERRLRLNANTRYRFGKSGRTSAGINFNHMVTDGTLFFLWKNDTTGAYIPATNTLSDYTTYRTTIDPYFTCFDRKGGSHKIRTRWFNTVNQNNTNQNSTADVYYAEYQFQKHFTDKVTITTGLVNQAGAVNSELYGNHHSNQFAIYLQGDIAWKKLTLSAGSRIEQNTVDGVTEKFQPVFRGGINYHLLKATFLRTSVGQGYRYPSIAERYIRTNVGSLYIYPNSELESEKGVSSEIGIRQGISAGNWTAYLDAAVFRNEYRNMIEFGFAQWGKSTDPLFGLGFRSFNVGKTRIDGIDLSLLCTGKISARTSLTLQGGLTIINPRQLTYDSLYIAKVGQAAALGSDSSDILKYRHRYSAKADAEFRYQNLSFGFGINYLSRMENIDRIFIGGILDAAFPPGLGIGHYRTWHKEGDLVCDARISWKFSPVLKISFIVKNLNNHLYMERPGDMQPPRTFELNLGFEK